MNKTKILNDFSAAIFGGTILGLTAFITLMNYGGNKGCWWVLDKLTGMAGYESCGFSGAVIGILVGVLLGLIIFNLINPKPQLRFSLMLLSGTFILPLLFAFLTFGAPFQSKDWFIAPPITLLFMFFSAIPSCLIIILMNWLIRK